MTTSQTLVGAPAYQNTIRRLKKLLQERGITPTMVSTLMGVDLSEVSRWLNLRVEMKMSSLFTLLEACNIEVAALFTDQIPTKRRKAA